MLIIKVKRETNLSQKHELEDIVMNKKNFYVGMGMGLIVGGAAAMAMQSKSRTPKSMLGRTLKTIGEVSDSISDMMGW